VDVLALGDGASRAPDGIAVLRDRLAGRVSAQGDLVPRWDALPRRECSVSRVERLTGCELDERDGDAVVRVDDERLSHRVRHQ
jgi:hypothetical protein